MRYGKRAILGLLVLAAFGGAFWFVFRKPTVAGAIGGEQTEKLGLRLEPRLLDLGTVMTNRETNFAAMIHNYGQQPVKLAKIEKSCGCTSVSVAKPICHPGEDVELKGTLIERKPGKFRHLVKVIEANESAPEHVLEVVGEAEASIRAYPESIRLSPSVFKNKAVESVIIIRNNSDERAAIREPTALPEGISVRITKGEIGPKQETKVVVRAEPRLFLETDLNLLFPTSHSSQENVAVTVQFRPENGFTVMPNKIRLGVVSKRELEASSIRLSLIGLGVENVAIKQILTPPFLKLAKESTRKGDRIEMEFAFAKSLPGMSIQGTIRIDLDVNAQGSDQKRTIGVNVPISGLVGD
jgi:hypothetical protein